MKKFSSVVFTFFVLLAGLMAQKDETLFGESGLRLTGAWGGLTLGSAIFSNEISALHGSTLGLEFNRLLSIGVGNERTTRWVTFDELDGKRFKLKQKGIFLGFSPLSHRVVHPRIGFSMARGEVETEERIDDIFVVQPAVGLELNVFSWWKFGLEGGYKFVTRSDTVGLENEDLSSFFINLQLRFGFSWGD